MDRVPIVEVDLTNVTNVLPSLMLAIKTSSFIALDLELSGLGNRKLLTTPNIEERYKHICEVANSRSILALGVSCFKLQDSPNNVAYLSQSFNIVSMCLDNYIIEPISIKFLVDHGFNFNRQYSSGLPYHRFNMEHDFQIKEGIMKKPSKKKLKSQIFSESILSVILKQIIIQNVPIVLHNALVDLVFLYCNFYSTPPDKLTQFISDVHLMFPAGVVDTKVIAEFKHHMQASYLDYVFKKCQRDNSREECKKILSIEFVPYSPMVHHYLPFFDCSLLSDDTVLGDRSRILCSNYANHGWCVNGVQCGMSHNIHLVLCFEEGLCDNAVSRNTSHNKKTSKQSKGNNLPELKDVQMSKGDESLNNGEIKNVNFDEAKSIDNDISIDKTNGDMNNINNTNNNVNNNNENNKNKNSSSSHGAGIDAFMTGYAFAYLFNKYKEKDDDDDENDDISGETNDLVSFKADKKKQEEEEDEVIHENEKKSINSNNNKDNGYIDNEKNNENNSMNIENKEIDTNTCNEKSNARGSGKPLGGVDFAKECVDRVYLCGKDFTLKVVPSKFVKPSSTNLKLLKSFKE